MDDFGFNVQPRKIHRPEWLSNETALKGVIIFSVIIMLFFSCKNFKLNTTRYMRGKKISMV
jgi:hypothetical protein